MKNLWIAIILALLLTATFIVGHVMKQCPKPPPVIYEKDDSFIDSLKNSNILLKDDIAELKKVITIYRQKNEKDKKPIAVHIDSLNNDSIPPVFLRLANYYRQ
ncbi:MAG: hypothetical protein PHW73_01105 [Atribacterota bacterium]|nr:hypothetical protein [Atribacterota bacterium]